MKIVTAEFITSAAHLDGMPADGKPEVAIIGRSNVGKSSLINTMLGRRALARTSRAPGKTQTANFYLVNEAFYLVDLPGLGYAKVSKRQRSDWTRLISRYLREREQLSVVVHLIDSRHDPTATDRDVIDYVREIDCAYVVALTKVDKLNQKERAKTENRITKVLESRGLEPPIVATSARKKEGIDDIWRWIELLG